MRILICFKKEKFELLLAISEFKLFLGYNEY